MSDHVLERFEAQRKRTDDPGGRSGRRLNALYREAGASWKTQIGARAGQRMTHIVMLKEAHNSGSYFGSSWQVEAFEADRHASALQIAEEWAGLSRRVIGWGSLPSDWDGNDGITPSRNVIAAALFFLTAARTQGVLVPKGFVAGDGEIGFRWEDRERFASAAFPPDGNIVAYSRMSQTEPAITLDEPFKQTIKFDRFFQSLKVFAK